MKEKNMYYSVIHFKIGAAQLYDTFQVGLLLCPINLEMYNTLHQIILFCSEFL